jgi:tyrosinase
MSNSPFIITGATGGSPNRLEINDFVNNVKFFSLYVQALQVMFANDQSIVQSFFSVGGIHGLPFQPWDDSTGSFDPNSGQWGGYCTHGSVLFPTWHRPYVMLYEQILQQRAVEIAATYTVDTEDWKQAAVNLRQPYWDWAVNAVPPSQVISDTQVTITGTDGKQALVDNPLYHYTFNPIDPSFPQPYSGWQTTIRQPTSQDSDATDDIAALQNVLTSEQSNITASTYNLLTRVHTWPAFSNHTVGDGGSSSNSLEAIHDGIHVDVGGDMSDPSVAAFDPIFFLHHCNVDRLLSLWSALNPGVWVSPGIAEDGGSFTTPPDAPYDQTSALTPFWNADTSFWASSAVTNTSKLGYSYPEFNGLDPTNTDATKTAIGNIVNQLYGDSGNSFAARSFFKKVPSASSTTSSHTRSLAPTKPVPASHSPPPAQHHSLLSQIAEQLHIHPSPPAVEHSRALPASHSPAHSQNAPSPHPTVVEHSKTVPASHSSEHSEQHPLSFVVDQSSAPPDRGLWEWTARVEFKKYELGSSFSVFIFLGPVPENPREWRTSPNYVGGHHAFVNSVANRCDNCTNQRDLVTEGFVHLNNAIAKHSGLGSLDPSVVEPYLTHNLHWRVQKTSGEAADLPSLEVAVIATPLSYPPGALFPVPGHPHRHNQITHGRSGGSRQA